jgi:hypothetical protein
VIGAELAHARRVEEATAALTLAPLSAFHSRHISIAHRILS